MDPARKLKRGLDVEAKACQRGVDLGVGLRLSIAAHGAKDDRRATIAEGERGDERMERTLARCQRVRREGIEREVGAAILQGDAGAVYHIAAAEAAIVALDQRDGVALLVGGTEIDRVAGEA